LEKPSDCEKKGKYRCKHRKAIVEYDRKLLIDTSNPNIAHLNYINEIKSCVRDHLASQFVVLEKKDAVIKERYAKALQDLMNEKTTWINSNNMNDKITPSLFNEPSTTGIVTNHRYFQFVNLLQHFHSIFISCLLPANIGATTLFLTTFLESWPWRTMATKIRSTSLFTMRNSFHSSSSSPMKSRSSRNVFLPMQMPVSRSA